MSSSRSFLLGIDQGTSGSRALVLDRDGQVRGYGYRPLASLHPQPDWVEQDPDRGPRVDIPCGPGPSVGRPHSSVNARGRAESGSWRHPAKVRGPRR